MVRPVLLHLHQARQGQVNSPTVMGQCLKMQRYFPCSSDRHQRIGGKQRTRLAGIARLVEGRRGPNGQISDTTLGIQGSGPTQRLTPERLTKLSQSQLSWNFSPAAARRLTCHTISPVRTSKERTHVPEEHCAGSLLGTRARLIRFLFVDRRREVMASAAWETLHTHRYAGHHDGLAEAVTGRAIFGMQRDQQFPRGCRTGFLGRLYFRPASIRHPRWRAAALESYKPQTAACRGIAFKAPPPRPYG